VIVIVLEAGRAPSLKNEIGRALVLVLRLIVCDAIGATRGTPPGRLKSTPLEDPPLAEDPHVIIDPSVLIAAKAYWLVYMRTTPDVRDPATEDALAPQTTTDPFDLRAAKASEVAKTRTTPEVSDDATEELFVSPHATTDPSDLRAANAFQFGYTRTTPDVRLADTLLLSPPPQ
jgi:hypothetical protein